MIYLLVNAPIIWKDYGRFCLAFNGIGWVVKNNCKKELKKFAKLFCMYLSLSHQTAKANHTLKF